MQKHQQLYSGKSKTLYATDDPKRLLVEFRDDVTAFNGDKKSVLARKGMLNNYVNSFIMRKLSEQGIPTHFEKIVGDNAAIVKNLQMFPLECVVRNIAAGGICKRLGIKEGTELMPAVFEFFLKDDALGDPMINEYHIQAFGWTEPQDVKRMQELTFKVNEVLKRLFLAHGMLLVDYKLEFGKYEGEIVLGDEFTPDGCRIWDVNTKKKLDKDNFRQDLGDVVQAYEEVARRLHIELP